MKRKFIVVLILILLPAVTISANVSSKPAKRHVVLITGGTNLLTGGLKLLTE